MEDFTLRSSVVSRMYDASPLPALSDIVAFLTVENCEHTFLTLLLWAGLEKEKMLQTFI